MWTAPARLGVPPLMLADIRNFYDGMQALMRTEDGECLHWFGAEQALRQGYVFAPLVFNVIFTVVLRAAVELFSFNASVKDMVCAKVGDKKGKRSEGDRRKGKINPRTMWRSRNRSGEFVCRRRCGHRF